MFLYWEAQVLVNVEAQRFMELLRDILKAVLMPVDQSLLADVRAEVVKQAAKRTGTTSFPTLSTGA